MKTLGSKVLKLEFEYRIFVSLGIVLLTCFLSFKYLPDQQAIIQLLFSSPGSSPEQTLKTYFMFLALFMIPLSLLRMWAGSLLSSDRVMSFKIVDDLFISRGPYLLSRNPIYLSDIAAITGCSLCLPLTGILMPVLFYLHYHRLINYEQKYLSKNFTDSYKKYLSDVPKLIPSPKSIKSFITSGKDFFINYDGFRNNSLYVLFIPGFIAAAVSGSFVTAIIIGFPGVIYWAVVHTKIGAFRNREKSVHSGSKVFKGVLYAQCWEDPSIDRAAFKITHDDVVFSITSGGCNVLTFLLDNPKEVIALDINSHQNYLLELKMAAIKILDYNDFLAFMGVTHCFSRKSIYKRLRPELTSEALAFWDSNGPLIKKGLIHCGRYESYMRLLRRGLNLIIGKRTIRKFFDTFGQEALESLYFKKWNNLRWKFFTRVLLSRRTMSYLFDKNFFKYVPDTFSFGEHFALKTRIALTRIPLRSNYFLSYILLGNYYDLNNLPSYMRRENYEIIRSRLKRIKIVNATCESFFAGREDDSINKFNFTNIFEWMSRSDFSELLNQTFRVSADKGIITYRNLLVLRESPADFNKKIRSNRLLSEELHRRDRAFIYNKYVVEEIVKREEKCRIEA